MTWLLTNSIVLYKESRSRYLLISSVIFFFAVALIVFRAPSLFYAPRFWAEEATVYFHMAYVSPLFETLIAPHQGYYVFWTNLAGILAATTVPLEYAPAVTTGMALLVFLAIIVAILVNESSALDTPLKKAIACLAAVVVGSSGELWLTSTNSQHVFPLLVFLILIDNKQNSLKRRCMYAIAVIAGLSGPESNFLTPLFLLRYWQKRERADLLLFLIFALTSVVELYSIIYSIVFIGDAAYANPSQKRLPTNIKPLRLIIRILYYGMGYPFFGYTRKIVWIGAALLMLSMFLARSQIKEFALFPLAVWIMTILTVLGSLDMAGGPRYAYTASVINSILLIKLSANVNLSLATRTLSGSLLAVSLFYWSWTFREHFYKYENPDWPAWSSEVKAWRADPTRELQVWPIWDNQTAIGWFWRMRLPPKPLGQL